MMIRYHRGLAPAALACTAFLLAACEGVPKDRGICPRVAILADAGRVVKFREGAPETPENIVYAGRMTDVRITCKYRDQQLTEMEADVDVTMVLERGPALRGDAVQLAYFVAVTDRRGTVLQKREFPMRISFAGNAAVEHKETSWQFFRFRRGFSGLAYETWTGFQLADREVQYNRRTVQR
jgi:hypothetical protein